MERIPPQTIVIMDDDKGVTCPDFMSTCSEEETPVVWEGESSFSGIETTELTVVGPENAIPDMKKCGAGQGHRCCIFMVLSPSGLRCERFGSMRFDLILMSHNMMAKRRPVKMFPACQDLEDDQ